MRFPLAWAAMVWLLCNSRISENKLGIFLSFISPSPRYWNIKVTAVATSHVMLSYSSCTCIRLNEPSNHFFSQWEHQKLFMKTSWTIKSVFASQSQEGMSRRIFYMLLWGSKCYLFHCSCGCSLFWAMMWWHWHPIGLDLGACLILPIRYIFYSTFSLILVS